MLKRRSKNIPGVEHTQEWYYERVGKRIRRIHGKSKSHPELEKQAQAHGILVHNKIFAEYLFELQEEQNYRYGDLETVTIQIIQP